MRHDKLGATDSELIAQAVAAGMVRRIPDPAPKPLPPLPPLAATSAPRPAVPAARVVKHLGIVDALEWAFSTERAGLALGGPGVELPSFGLEFVLIQQAMLGAQVDTSRGRSSAADDAELIADAVSSALLPPDAIWVAEMARAGQVPNAMVGAVPRCVPKAWSKGNQFGRLAKSEVVNVVSYRWGARMIKREVRATPVTYVPTASQIAAARRGWLDWCGHLLSIRAALQAVDLQWIQITDDMPPLTPWRESR